jgi:hypothetical protein
MQYPTQPVSGGGSSSGGSSAGAVPSLSFPLPTGGPPASASAAEQLQYWIAQCSRLSDSVLAAQLRANSAEAEVARLAPLEAQWPVLAAEACTLSEARADALVENARLHDYNEQLRSQHSAQAAEIAQLRRSLADRDTAATASAHSAATASVALQNAYQSKLSAAEEALSAAQSQLASHAQLQHHYQILHAKYENAKKVRLGSEELLQQNEAYKSQMNSVAQELEDIRADMLRREEERAALLHQVDTLTEQLGAYKTHLPRATQRIDLLQQALKRTSDRTKQQLQSMRDRHAALRRECVYVLQQEHERMGQVVAHVLSTVAQVSQKHQQQVAHLQATLQEDHLMHNLQIRQQEAKMQQLLDAATGVAANNALLHRTNTNNSSNGKQQTPSAGAPTGSFIPTAVSAVPVPSMLPSATNSSSGGAFDLRDWLAMQQVTAAAGAAPPAVPGASVTNGAAAAPIPATSAARPFASPTVTSSAALARSAPAVRPTGGGSSLAHLLGSARFLAPPSASPRASLAPYAALPIPGSSPAYAPQSHLSASTDGKHAAASATTAAVPITRSIHVQRLAEVEAALLAMADM